MRVKTTSTASLIAIRRPWCIAALLLAMSIVADGAFAQAPYTGAELYRAYCASCHGASGRGDGPVASSMKVEVPDLTRIMARQGRFPTEQIRRIIDGRTTLPPHGTRDMPVWGREFRSAAIGVPPQKQPADKLIDLLVDYVRSIQQRAE